MKFAATILFAALVSSVQAAVQITYPSSTYWWVAGGPNLLVWTCGDPDAPSQYLVTFKGSGALQSGITLINPLPNADCSYTVQVGELNLGPGSGFTIVFTALLNITDVYATSGSFEIKPAGSDFPPAASTTTTSTPATSTPSGSSTTSSTAKAQGAAASPIGASSAIVSGIAFVLIAFLA